MNFNGFPTMESMDSLAARGRRLPMPVRAGHGAVRRVQRLQEMGSLADVEMGNVELQDFRNEMLGAKLSLKKIKKGVKKLTVAKVLTAGVSAVSAKAGKKVEKQLTSGFRVARGTVGFTTGLLKGELKKAKIARKVVVAVAGVAGAVVLAPLAISAAASLFGTTTSAALGAVTAANKARALVGLGPVSPADLLGKLKKRKADRAAAGLPPETDEQAAQAIATEAAAASASELTTPAGAQAQAAQVPGAVSEETPAPGTPEAATTPAKPSQAGLAGPIAGAVLIFLFAGMMRKKKAPR